MMSFVRFLGALLVSAFFPGDLLAETIEVRVMDSRFIPNDLTIQVGDTVRWTNAPGGLQHNVKADDLSFSSQTGSSFTFEQTFDSIGEILYHCPVHSAPGLDRDTNMYGRIVVEGDAAAFLINAGLNDAWYNPLTLGQGFFITVFPDLQQIFLAWFTFDVEQPPEDVTAMLGDPGHRWLTAFGDYVGDTAILEIEVTQGGIFDSGEPAPVQGPDGTITVKFSGCNAGTVTYEIDSLLMAGVIPVERIALDNVASCESFATR